MVNRAPTPADRKPRRLSTTLGYCLGIYLAACCVCIAAPPTVPDPDQPASFDCSRAAGVDEKLICSDALLRHADLELSRHYKELLQSIPDASRVALIRSDEHSWIIRRNYECGVSKSLTITDPDRAAYVDCFIAAYEERQWDLARIKDDPSADPTSISTPIRRSLYNNSELASPLPATSVVATGLTASTTGPDALSFKPDGTLLVAQASRSAIDIAVTSSDATQPAGRPAGRFVRLVDANGARVTDPAIRIDRRATLTATFDAFTKSYVIQPALPQPSSARDTTLRRWAKFDCEAYWSVGPESGKATRGCIPYGTYSGTPVTVLPARPGVFFGGSSGLYRVSDGKVVQILATPVLAPAVSPDGCSIAFIGNASGTNEVRLASLCAG